jgi:hypothetical protein
VSDNDKAYQPQKAGNLDGKEREANSHHGIRLDESDVRQRLENTRNDHSRCESIHQVALHVSNVKREDNSAKDRQVFETIRMRPGATHVPSRPFHLLGPKALNRRTPRQDVTPSIDTNSRYEEKHCPCRKRQEHPHGLAHVPSSLVIA